MSPTELKGIIGALIGAIAYFLVREFTRKDKIAADLEAFKTAMSESIRNITDEFKRELRAIADRNTEAIDGLNTSVASLAVAIQEQRADNNERFVFAEDHEKDIQRLKGDIERHAERFEKELEKHAKVCPAMR